MEALELIAEATREASWTASSSGHDGTNDLLVSDVLGVNEFQVWFVSEQLAGTVIADAPDFAGRSLVKAHA
jgi:starvation-inducible DNA-binding protein